jgi:GNAT superfamily N-acetyltransferase
MMVCEMKPPRLTADLAQAQDTDSILELNVQEYGPGDILATHADFAWRHDQNPAGQAVVPVIRDNHGRVIGFIWLVPLLLRLRGKDRLAAAGTNLVIHPRYRNTFGYTKLIRRFEQVFRDRDIPLHMSFISEREYQELNKNAPQTVSTIPLLIRPLVPGFMAHRRLGSVEQEITVKTVEQFDSSFDQFWRQVQDKYPVMAIRASAFLAWRFKNISGRRYHILVAQVDDQIAGYAVLRCATVRRIKMGLVMDLLVRGDAVGEAAGARLMFEAAAFFRACGVLFAVGLMAPGAVEYRILRRAGYVHLPAALAPRVFHFAFFVHNRRERDLTALSAQDWFVTLADYESF